ncbi:MAG: hypothetical protein BWK76_13015 [Desulfobulbaceae bacterium A2]|nr:MAG: hypothetical protein BWK76_13015 [Desulfobulbaceae bacterium A2]
MSRYRFLSWPLTFFEQSAEIRRDDFPIPERAKKTKYPIRALRYWWLRCAIHEEHARSDRPLVIVDVGCERGMSKRIVGELSGACWIGLDMTWIEEIIRHARYQQLHRCDFDRELPLADATADIIIFSHVLEHLPRPDFTLGELSRILKPGGMLLLGVPVAPHWIARWREQQFRREFRCGTRWLGRHAHAFWPDRIRRMAQENGLAVEFLAGTYLLRRQGSPLENHAGWIRLNQAWGALFPSLSQELCVQLRKAAV